MSGKNISVSWTEVPADVGDWWKNNATTPLDRLVSGIAEMRVVTVRIIPTIPLAYPEATNHVAADFLSSRSRLSRIAEKQ